MDRALFRELNECVCGLNYLGGFKCSGYLYVNAAASSESAFTYRRILHSPKLLQRPEALEVCEGALSKLLVGKVYDHLGFSSVWPAASGAHSVQKIACLFTDVSCQCSELGAHLRRRSSFFCGRSCAAHVALEKNHQERVTREGLANIYYDPLLSHNVCSLVKSCSITFCSTSHVSLESFGFARRACSCVSFWKPNGQTNISGYIPNSRGQLEILSRVSNFPLARRLGVKRLCFIW